MFGGIKRIIRVLVLADKRVQRVPSMRLDSDFCVEKAQPRTVVECGTGIGGSSMADYLTHVRAQYDRTTHCFDTGLPWASRDAMEVTMFSK
jgi:hypothetical protein